jgi:hypothetical protein
MIAFLRVSILLSLVALLVGALIPFEQPYQASFPMDRPPAWPLLAAFGAVLTVTLQVISAYGLFRFRRWAPTLAALTTICLVALALIAMLAPSIASVASTETKAMAIASSISWMAAVLLTRTSRLRAQYGIAL